MVEIDAMAVRLRYSVMPDYGDAYGWRTPDDSVLLLGPNIADNNGWYGEHAISADLHARFAAWQLVFEREDLYLEEVAEAFDWERFHQRGLELTRRLKAEIGAAARVCYVKPIEDPNHLICRRVEILDNGSVREWPWQRPSFPAAHGDQ